MRLLYDLPNTVRNYEVFLEVSIPTTNVEHDIDLLTRLAGNARVLLMIMLSSYTIHSTPTDDFCVAAIHLYVTLD
jgi:hypothetical protein